MSHDQADIGIYGRLIEWGAWATARRHIPERHDDVAGDFKLTPAISARIARNRQGWFPPHIEAVEKAVATLNSDTEMSRLISEYFLDWKTVESIAKDRYISEHVVTNGLHRAMRIVAARLRFCEAKMQLKGAPA